jgi:hypothetical protein
MSTQLAKNPDDTTYPSNICVGDTLYLQYDRAVDNRSFPAGTPVTALPWEPPANGARAFNLLVQTEDGHRLYVHTTAIHPAPSA